MTKETKEKIQEINKGRIAGFTPRKLNKKKFPESLEIKMETEGQKEYFQSNARIAINRRVEENDFNYDELYGYLHGLDDMHWILFGEQLQFENSLIKDMDALKDKVVDKLKNK